MKVLFHRELDDLPFTAFTERERTAVCASHFLFLAAEMLEWKAVEPGQEAFFRKRFGYFGDEVKVLGEGEREAFSLARPVTLDGESALAYQGTLLATGGAADGRLIFRGVSGSGALEQAYRKRYGALLLEDQPLPAEHLLTFEVLSVRAALGLNWREVDTHAGG